MAWGSTQEAAALFSVMHLFPSSQLEEVGLCWVDPKSQIPPEWGLRMEDLPPLGASPDGLIRHKLKAPPPPPPTTALSKAATLPQSQVFHAAPAHAAESALQSNGSGNLLASHATQSSETAQSSAAQTSDIQQSSTLHGQPQAIGTSLSDFEALLAKLEISSKQLNSNQAQLSQNRTASASSPGGAAVAKPVAVAPPSADADALPAATGSHPTDAPQATPPQREFQEEWLEAVEIKNVCPFREVREVSSNGKAKRLYRLSDPGPYSRVCGAKFSLVHTGLQANFLISLHCDICPTIRIGAYT